jgi:hypothetical protein
MADTPPLNLRAAARSLASIEGLAVVGPWERHGARWALPCRIDIAPANSAFVATSTAWYLLADESYPWGRVKFHPAKAGGITHTFPHQSFNGVGQDAEPWRSGDLCLGATFRTLGRQAVDPEPYDATGPASRIAWHGRRAVAWVRAAAEDRLLAPGDPFELPAFLRETRVLLATAETPQTWELWSASDRTFGLADVTPLTGRDDVWVTRELRTIPGQSVVTYGWGRGVEDPSRSGTAAWVRLPQLPAIPPWQPPVTWADLRGVCGRFGIDLDQRLQRLAAHLRDGRAHFLLVGFPVPAAVGDLPVRMHWEAALLPVLSNGIIKRKGFRTGDNPVAHWREDCRSAFADDLPIPWVATENWSTAELGSRGHLPPPFGDAHVVVVGCGALGSAVAELLARGGVTRITLLDGEDLQAGNLCRHTLILGDIRRGKAVSLGQRLAAVSPHMRVTVIPHEFPPPDATDHEVLRTADMVIDCTAADDLPRALARYPWGRPVRFANLWLGQAGRRLYCYTARGERFPAVDLEAREQPWRRREVAEFDPALYPREGVGCWHPVFPARADDVWLFAAAAVKHLESVLTGGGDTPQLAVFQKREADGLFAGLDRLPESTPDA